VSDLIPMHRPVRELARQRRGHTRSVMIGGSEAYVIASQAEDGHVGEVMLKLGKHGSTVAGLTDTISILLTLALQYGVPLETLEARLSGLRFEPAGHTDDPDLPTATSVVDYMVRRLTLDHATQIRQVIASRGTV